MERRREGGGRAAALRSSHRLLEPFTETGRLMKRLFCLPPFLPPSLPPPLPPHHSLSRPSASKTQLAASLGGVWGSGEAAASTADVQINISRH